MRIHNVSMPMAIRPAMATKRSPMAQPQPSVTFAGEDGAEPSARLKGWLIKSGLIVGGGSPIAMQLKITLLETLAAIGGPAAIGVAIGAGLAIKRRRNGDGE